MRNDVPYLFRGSPIFAPTSAQQVSCGSYKFRTKQDFRTKKEGEGGSYPTNCLPNLQGWLNTAVSSPTLSPPGTHASRITWIATKSTRAQRCGIFGQRKETDRLLLSLDANKLLPSKLYAANTRTPRWSFCGLAVDARINRCRLRPACTRKPGDFQSRTCQCLVAKTGLVSTV